MSFWLLHKLLALPKCGLHPLVNLYGDRLQMNQGFGCVIEESLTALTTFSYESIDHLLLSMISFFGPY